MERLKLLELIELIHQERNVDFIEWCQDNPFTTTDDDKDGLSNAAMNVCDVILEKHPSSGSVNQPFGGVSTSNNTS